MYSRHEFARYPEGHAFTRTCLICGRIPEHPYHDTKEQRDLEESRPPDNTDTTDNVDVGKGTE